MLYEQIGIRNVSNLLISTATIRHSVPLHAYPTSFQFVCYSLVKAVLLASNSYPFSS